MHLNVLTQCTPTPMFEGLWRVPEESAARYRSLEYWLSVAQALDGTGVDALFFADVVGTYGGQSQGFDASIRHAVQTPAIDPVLVIPALAAATRHLGFAVTYSTSTHHPYDCARIFSTLDHLSDGRIAWNIVTSDERLTAPTGMTTPLGHDQRYDRAEEFVQACLALWEDSWRDDAVVTDRDGDVFAAPDRVQAIHHHGAFFDFDVPHQCEPSPQRTPVLYQAGASPRGRDFAARYAEAIFITARTFAQAAEQVDDLRSRLAHHRRTPSSVKVIQGMSLLLGRDDAEVRHRAEEFQRWSSRGGILAKWSGWTGVDLSRYPQETPLSQVDPSEMQSVRQFLGGSDAASALTVGDLVERIATPRRLHRFSPASLVGTAAQVADRMEQWMDRTGVDGFNVSPIPSQRGLTDLTELLLPELRRRGLVTAAASDTLRERYRGPGNWRYIEPPTVADT